MILYEYYLVFPDGERQEIPYPVQVYSLVDMNGRALNIPLPTNKMLAYQVSGKRTFEERGIVQTFYLLEQLDANELMEFT
ncbi:hypothetical protein [Treponema phagedenis]|uniref:hypothetical protein n=1 Tax=Treponema phagedenis TaxID=162 RepID=UPI0011E654CF|nr:hypothetical protein [Treponema phagedenis]QEJ94049.1 hypothetical protein FUT79_01670 [Treponema phagedenis]QEK01941.1 hypothetical protein FUT84_12740 [Treponema phagedenis]QEK07053.1 hypothetical protein FUT80_10220 [Treponema phagedenis]QSH95330.1 hypothetical protein C5O78_09930 [Treponema phagedenis]